MTTSENEDPLDLEPPCAVTPESRCGECEPCGITLYVKKWASACTVNPQSRCGVCEECAHAQYLAAIRANPEALDRHIARGDDI